MTRILSRSNGCEIAWWTSRRVGIRHTTVVVGILSLRRLLACCNRSLLTTCKRTCRGGIRPCRRKNLHLGRGATAVKLTPQALAIRARLLLPSHEFVLPLSIAAHPLLLLRLPAQLHLVLAPRLQSLRRANAPCTCLRRLALGTLACNLPLFALTLRLLGTCSRSRSHLLLLPTLHVRLVRVRRLLRRTLHLAPFRLLLRLIGTRSRSRSHVLLLPTLHFNLVRIRRLLRRTLHLAPLRLLLLVKLALHTAWAAVLCPKLTPLYL